MAHLIRVQSIGAKSWSLAGLCIGVLCTGWSTLLVSANVGEDRVKMAAIWCLVVRFGRAVGSTIVVV